MISNFKIIGKAGKGLLVQHFCYRFLVKLTISKRIVIECNINE